MSYAALWALGMTSYVLIGAIAGATNLIPYVGPFVGAVLALLVPAERYSSEETASRWTNFCRGRWNAGKAGDDERLGRVRLPHFSGLELTPTHAAASAPDPAVPRGRTDS